MRKLLLLLIVCAVFACKKSSSDDNNNNPPPPPVTAEIVKGADISWVTQMEGAGIKFYNSAGVQTDCFQLMKDLSMAAIRLRVWVDPGGGWNGMADVVAKAQRATAMGLKIMIDFHYSDSWADPGQQTKPAAWTGQNITALAASVTSHTTAVLNALKAVSIKPAWVQVGNETNDGMLWPEGKASVNMGNFAQLVNAGYNAVKAVDPAIKVIVHISNGYDNSLFRWMFDGLKANGAQWDIIGMSLYPSAANWQTLNTQCLANMNDMVGRYDKDVMITEIGMSWDQGSTCNAFISDLITKVKSVTNSRGLGIFYWEPEAYNNWQGYSLGAFDNSGKPTTALNAFH